MGKQTNNATDLYSWLRAHKLISLRGLCAQVGTHSGNFWTYMQAGAALKPEILEKFEAVLKPYGYDPSPVIVKKVGEEYGLKQAKEAKAINGGKAANTTYLEKRRASKSAEKSK